MAEMIENLVSTIIPVFNRPVMLRQAVDSVLAQSWRPIEIIICDDGSTDETVALGPALARDHPEIRYLWNPNRGAGPAREAGRQLARGEFIQYLDSDDTLWPDKFSRQIEALRAHPECGAAYGWIRLCPEDGPPGERPHKWSGRALPTLFPWLLADRWWNTDTPLWRRTVCDAIGPWSDFRYSQDWEYDARAGGLGVRLAHTPEFVCDQRHHAADRQTGHGRWLTPPERVRFFSLLLQHACTTGLGADAPEIKHFSRWVFAHARQCAELGDESAAIDLFALARRTAGGTAADMQSFALLVRLLGWRRAASLAETVHHWTKAGPGRFTRKQSWMEEHGQ